MDGGRENRFLAGGAEISGRGGGMTAAPARTKAKAPMQNSIGAQTVDKVVNGLFKWKKARKRQSNVE